MVAEYVESGQSQGEYCRERGLGVSRLQYWLRKTAELEEASPGSAGGSGFVELKVEGLAGSREDGRQSPADLREYEIVLANGRRLVVRGGFDLSEVTALVSVLEERSW